VAIVDVITADVVAAGGGATSKAACRYNRDPAAIKINRQADNAPMAMEIP